MRSVLPNVTGGSAGIPIAPDRCHHLPITPGLTLMLRHTTNFSFGRIMPMYLNSNRTLQLMAGAILAIALMAGAQTPATPPPAAAAAPAAAPADAPAAPAPLSRSEEHTSELQSL